MKEISIKQMLEELIRIPEARWQPSTYAFISASYSEAVVKGQDLTLADGSRIEELYYRTTQS